MRGHVGCANWTKPATTAGTSHLLAAVVEGAVQRVRPKVMTVATTILGLLPIMWAPTMGTGASVTKRIAAPMIGGLLTSVILTLVVVPTLYYLWQRAGLARSKESP